MEKFVLAIPLLTGLVVPSLLLANGGDQRIVEGKYLINLSRAPFTPYAGVKTSMVVSFADIQKDALIAEPLMVKVRITKLNGGATVYESKERKMEGGVLSFPYTFAEPGLHEIFFDFAFASSPQKIYSPPDFLLDVQEPKAEKSTPPRARVASIESLLGFLSGFLGGWLLRGIAKDNKSNN